MSTTGLDEKTHELLLGTIRQLGKRALSSAAGLDWDGADLPPEHLLRTLLGRDLALHLPFLPADCGGMGCGTWDLYRVCEELAKLDLGVATSLVALGTAINPVRAGATPEQRQRWLGEVAAWGLWMGLAVTEPTAGSSLLPLETMAQPLEEGGQVVAYRLKGLKQFVTNGGIADLYLVLAQAPGGPSFFVIKSDTAGLTSSRREAKHGLRSSPTTPLVLEDVVVPADQLIGLAEGKGLEQANAVFAHSRVMVAALGLGGGEAALGRAIAYSKERLQGGKPLAQHKGFTHKLLLPHVVRLEAARSFLGELARRIDLGESGLEAESAAAKLFATEAGNAAADAAIQSFGGYGYFRSSWVEKVRRDVRATTLLEGTSELQQLAIFLGRFRQMLKSKGAFYRELAPPVRALGPAVAGELVASTAEALGHALTALHQQRIGREQHAMFELADRIAEVEHAMAFCRRAAAEAPALQAACRLFAAEVAGRVASSALRLMAGSAAPQEELSALASAMGAQDLLMTRVGSEEDKALTVAWLLESGWPG